MQQIVNMPKIKKVLVTGANGLLGANIVAQLLKKGYNVCAMVRPGCNMNGLKNLNCEVFEGLMANFYELEEAIKTCHYVIHCASRTKQFPTRLDLFTRTNIDSTAFLIELCKKYHIERLIYISTANCFTNGTLEQPGDETGGFMPWLQKSGYAYSKFIAQQMVLNESKINNFDAIIVAPTFVIGTRDSKPSSGQILLYIARNSLIFYPPGGKSFVDAEKAAIAIVNSITKGKKGQCYLISGENLTYKDFFKIVARKSKKRKILIPIPGYLLTLISLFCDLIEKTSRISLPLNLVNKRLLCLGNYFSNEKAKKELMLQPTSIDLAVEKALEWFSTYGYIK